MKLCSIDGCEREHHANGWCSMHWQRVKAWGHPGEKLPIRNHGSLLDRISNKVLIGDGCWNWTGSHTTLGYGTLMLEKRPRPAHRIVYELFNGLIADGLELDHLCRNPKCVRPAHLEPVSHRKNLLRGKTATATHCKNGHEWNEESIYWRTDGPYPSRQCRLCGRERDRKRRPRKTVD